MLCHKCSNIHFRRFEYWESKLANAQWIKDKLFSNYRISGCVFYVHHETREALELSSDNGCHFCGMLVGRLSERSYAHNSSGEDSMASSPVVLRRSVVDQWLTEENGMEQWNQQDWIYVHCRARGLPATTTSQTPLKGKIVSD
jgi:hypothetical protein